ncbi:Cmgc/cdk protein kinase, partial [Globisporangium splendens]
MGSKEHASGTSSSSRSGGQRHRRRSRSRSRSRSSSSDANASGSRRSHGARSRSASRRKHERDDDRHARKYEKKKKHDRDHERRRHRSRSRSNHSRRRYHSSSKRHSEGVHSRSASPNSRSSSSRREERYSECARMEQERKKDGEEVLSKSVRDDGDGVTTESKVEEVVTHGTEDGHTKHVVDEEKPVIGEKAAATTVHEEPARETTTAVVEEKAAVERAVVTRGKDSAGDRKSFRFEHLEAIRNVHLITRNEYPLPHLPREKVLHRDYDDDEEDEDSAVCYCSYPDALDKDKKRCEDVSCLNFATYVECNSNCPAREYCGNQRLQHTELFPVLEAFKTEKKGFGVRTTQNIAQSSIIGEYVGEVIDQKELNSRLKSVPRWTVKGETRIAVIALRDINEGEELTFDYQWKSLGSRQIKCFCESANCKGIIGTEGDTVKDDTPNGYFREPTKQEVGAAIINRRIRIFKSPDDHTQYYIATVKSYDKKDDIYEVDYQDMLYVAEEDEDGDLFEDSPKERNSERFIRLSEMGWHIFFELDGLSEDQIEKEVFSIPKRRLAESREHEGHSTRSSQEPSPTTAALATNGKVQQSSSVVGKREQDAQGEAITNKILVKGIPAKCSESTLRQLFILDDRFYRMGHSDSRKKQQPQSALAALDFFFFDDDSGWALAEFTDPQHTSYFHRNLNSRPLYGKDLRVFLAGKKEIENFYRAKRNFALRCRQEKKADLKPQSSLEEKETSAPKKVIQPYCFGRKLNWQVSVEQMEDSPSRRYGISPSLEQSLRTKCVKFILRLVKKLHFERDDATSAIIALNRYFTFHAMDVRTEEMMAASMLHLFVKAHSRNYKRVSFVSEVYAAKSLSEETRLLDETSDEFLNTERQLLAVEKQLLEGLRYDISGEDPYALLDALTSGKYRKKLPADGTNTNSSSGQLPPSEVQKEAKHLISDTLRLPIWVQMPVECVVLSIFYLSAAVTQVLKEVANSSSTPAPSTSSVPEYLPVLDGQRNELETLMLLDCSLSICESLKDRWTRLEKNVKASRKSDRSEDYFDTEEFALSHEKHVEISQRISNLIKSWINVPSSSSVPGSSASPVKDDSRVAGKDECITLSTIGRSPSVSGSEASRDEVEVAISAGLVVPKVVAKGPGGGSSSVLSSTDRLHSTEITNVDKIRKRSYLGVVSEDVAFDLAGKKVYLQPWPYRDNESPFSAQGGISKSCVRELSTAIMLHNYSPSQFIKLLGVVFPEEKTAQSTQQQSNGSRAGIADLDVDMVDFSDMNGQMRSSSSLSSRLESSEHYLAFEQPLHMYSGIFEAKGTVPVELKKKAIYDMLRGLAVCHENGFVHRFVAPSHLFLFKNGVKLGGYHAMRKVSSTKTKDGSSNVYEMSEDERKEHSMGPWLNVSAPEILLGDCNYSWRCDIWSVGCVALAILLDNTPFLQANETRVQLDLIFRLCGTPRVVWDGAMKLPLFGRYKPKNEYKMRLQKTLVEQQKQKHPDLPEEAIALLEAMLQLDPSKRMSAKRLLELEFFADVRNAPASAFDFSGLPETYSTQKKKLQQHLKASKLKRKRSSNSGEHQSSSSHRSSGSSSSHYHRSSERGGRDASSRKNREPDAEMAEDVPLPAFFNPASDQKSLEESASSVSSSSQHRPEKRAKLGWGMGLHSESTT